MDADQEIPQCPLQSQHPATGVLWYEKPQSEEPKSSECGAEGDASPYLTKPYTEWGLVSRTHSELLRANQAVQSGLSEGPMADAFRKNDGLAPSGQSARGHDGRDEAKGYWGDVGYSNRKGALIGGPAHANNLSASTSGHRQTWCSFEGCSGEAGTCHTDRTEDIH